MPKYVHNTTRDHFGTTLKTNSNSSSSLESFSGLDFLYHTMAPSWGRFHVGLGLFRGFVISQAAAHCHSVLRKNIPFQETSTIGSSEKSLSYTVEHQVITQNIPLQ
ncbi:uncharacterized protein [Montipora capricornis]|uniref:uncharacterized protein isoform X2 n=1 Tax=Montipora capricornis TaxID=246305 RepID=UPI0035F1382F